MRCNKAREFVSQELDAVLPPDATGNLRDHLDACHDCRDYREDLLLGQRIMRATEPELPDNFEWKLQLKLNQSLQQAAGETRYPWHQPQRLDRWAWLRNFGAATAVGLAAVLALAMVFGPLPIGTSDGTTGGTTSSPVAVNGTDRRPLFQPGNGGLYGQQLVSGAGRSLGTIDRGWSGSATEDLKLIRRLKVENQRLGSMLLQYQRANALLRAQLDTSGTNALDLQQNR